MARRNKKKNSEGIPFPAPFAVVLAILSVLSICYLFLGVRCMSIGEDIKTLETEQENLNKIRLNEEYKWSEMKSPRNMLSAMRQHNLEMDWPTRDQIVYLDVHADYTDGLSSTARPNDDSRGVRGL